MRRLRMSKNDFELLAILGKGGFGEVYLSRKRDTGEILALKKIPKTRYTTDMNDVIEPPTDSSSKTRFQN